MLRTTTFLGNDWRTEDLIPRRVSAEMRKRIQLNISKSARCVAPEWRTGLLAKLARLRALRKHRARSLSAPPQRARGSSTHVHVLSFQQTLFHSLVPRDSAKGSRLQYDMIFDMRQLMQNKSRQPKQTWNLLVKLSVGKLKTCLSSHTLNASSSHLNVWKFSYFPIATLSHTEQWKWARTCVSKVNICHQLRRNYTAYLFQVIHTGIVTRWKRCQRLSLSKMSRALRLVISQDKGSHLMKFYNNCVIKDFLHSTANVSSRIKLSWGFEAICAGY